MSATDKKLKKAIQHLLDAEDALDSYQDVLWEKLVERREAGKSIDKVDKRHHRVMAFSGLTYELRRLLETL
jgi:hypothetical protein